MVLLPVMALLLAMPLAAQEQPHEQRLPPRQVQAPVPADTATCRVVVINAETGRRVRGAVISSGTRRDTTIWDGTARMASHFGEAVVWHPAYMTRHLSGHLASDTIRLIPTAHQIAEVEVWGNYSGKKFVDSDDDVSAQLAANQEKAKGFNPLGLVVWVVKKLLPRRRKLTRKEKQKIILDNY